MTEICSMTQGHKYWNETISLAAKCSWKAGFYLAQKMKDNDFGKWERVFVACVNGKVAGFCTFAERDELPKEYKLKGLRLSATAPLLINTLSEGLTYGEKT